MYHLNVSLNYLKIYKTHYIIGQGEYSLEYKWTLDIIKYLFVDMWARTHGWLRAWGPSGNSASGLGQLGPAEGWAAGASLAEGKGCLQVTIFFSSFLKDFHKYILAVFFQKK